MMTVMSGEWLGQDDAAADRTVSEGWRRGRPGEKTRRRERKGGRGDNQCGGRRKWTRAN